MHILTYTNEWYAILERFCDPQLKTSATHVGSWHAGDQVTIKQGCDYTPGHGDFVRHHARRTHPEKGRVRMRWWQRTSVWKFLAGKGPNHGQGTPGGDGLRQGTDLEWTRFMYQPSVHFLVFVWLEDKKAKEAHKEIVFKESLSSSAKGMIPKDDL